MDDERPGSLTACAGCRERDALIAESQRRLADSERRTTELERKLAEMTRDSQRHADVQSLAKHLRHHRHERFLFLYDPDIPATNNLAELKSVRE